MNFSLPAVYILKITNNRLEIFSASIRNDNYHCHSEIETLSLADFVTNTVFRVTKLFRWLNVY